MIILGIILCLIGGALMETPIIGMIHGANGIGAVICGVIFGALFFVPGILFIVSAVKALIHKRFVLPLKDVFEALKPGYREASGDSFLDKPLVSFREHYCEFFGKDYTVENEAIQKDVTQIFRNVLQFQKNRLQRLGLTCELLLKRMAYTKKDGLDTKFYSDGKYKLIDVTEQVAAKTIYKKDGKAIHTKVDKEIANYTIVQAQKVGADTILCPNCGAESTRNALLDGCDYCGTKFTVEDLGSRIAVFAFRPDVQLRYEKYKRARNKLLFILISGAILSVFLGFTVYAIVNAPALLAEADGGIILTTLASFFAILIASPVYILSFLVVNLKYALLPALVLGGAGYFIARQMKKKKNRPMLAQQREQQIRRQDPDFSFANFYSGLQNKLSSVIFAENAQQLQAFAVTDLSRLLGRYSNVVGVDVDYMEITDFRTDNTLQSATVDARLYLTRYNGSRCHVQRQTLTVRLIKDASCKTQAVCAPAVLHCQGCGSSLDLLQGKQCPYCGRELALIHYDWVIAELQTDRDKLLRLTKKACN